MDHQNMDVRLQGDRQTLGAEIFETVLAYERSLQETLKHGGQLTALLATAPERGRLAYGYGQGVVQRIAASLGHISDARGAVATAHTGLARMQDELGVKLDYEDFFSFPPDKEKPPHGEAAVIPITGVNRAA